MNLQRLDLNLLVAFDALYRARSVTIAASHLGLSQSATSNALNRLRQTFDDPLFVRTSSGMVPTPKAEKLAQPIREVLARVRDALTQDSVFDPKTSERTFRIYMTDVGQLVLLPRVFQAVVAEAPGINIQTVQVPPFRAREQAMELGEVDLAVGYFESFEGPFHTQRLFDEHYVCMVRADHPVIHDSITLEQFLSGTHLVYWPSGGGHGFQEGKLEEAFEAHNIRRRIALRVTHFPGLVSIMSSTDLLVTLPSMIAQACIAFAPLKVFDVPVVVPRFDVTQHWHERYHHDSGNRWLRSIFNRLWARVNPPAAFTSSQI